MSGGRRKRSLLEDVRSMEGLGDGDMAVEELSDGRQKLVRWNALQRGLRR